MSIVSLKIAKTICFAAIAISPLSGAEMINVYVGQSYVIPDQGITNVVVGSDSVLRATPLPGKGLVLTGVSPGDTSVKIWKGSSYYASTEVHVSAHNLERVRTELEKNLQQIKGLSFFIVSDQVVIMGTKLSVDDKIKVDTISSLFPESVKNFTTSIAEPMIQQDEMVYFDVRIVELSDSNNTEIGIDWGDQVDGPKAAVLRDLRKDSAFESGVNPFADQIGAYPKIASTQAYLGIAALIESKINLMQSKGKARILARPLLSSKNGSKASFLSGGQIPYQTVGATGTPQIEFKDYGIKLDIQPKLVQGGISTTILTEVSNLDTSVSIDGVPGLFTRRTETEFVVGEGKTIVLSGLVSADLGSTEEGVPLLSGIPVLGNLFKNKIDRSKKTELIIFVTPYLYDVETDETLLASQLKGQLEMKKTIKDKNEIIDYNMQGDVDYTTRIRESDNQIVYDITIPAFQKDTGNQHSIAIEGIYNQESGLSNTPESESESKNLTESEPVLLEQIKSDEVSMERADSSNMSPIVPNSFRGPGRSTYSRSLKSNLLRFDRD